MKINALCKSSKLMKSIIKSYMGWWEVTTKVRTVDTWAHLHEHTHTHSNNKNIYCHNDKENSWFAIINSVHIRRNYYNIGIFIQQE